MAKQNICGRPTPILPSVYQETLTYGETLGVVAQKVNECVDEVNTNDKKVDDLTNLVGTFDNRIAENTQNISSNTESINSLDSRIGSLESEIPQFESSISTQLGETNNKVDANTNSISILTETTTTLQNQIDTINNDTIPSIDFTTTTLREDVNTVSNKVSTLTNTTIPAIETKVNANTAAIAKSKEKMTLLADITISQDTAGIIDLISNTRLSNFYVEMSIPKTSNNTNTTGQLILYYTDENDILYLTSQYARGTAITNTTFNVVPINGIHLYIFGNHSASPAKVLGNSQVAIHMNDTLVNKIRFKLLNNVSIPVGSTFKIYGILED